jgi:hypothetical protein
MLFSGVERSAPFGEALRCERLVDGEEDRRG